jgi:membrane associated rhomboid family serine protease
MSYGNFASMGPSERAAVRLGSALSVVAGLWGLSAVAFPFGLVGGAGAALFGLTFGVLAIRTRAWGQWRKTALIGIGISSLTLLVAAAEVVYFVISE